MIQLEKFTQNAVAISTGPYTHLDHLGVLAALLNIPLIVCDSEVYTLARKYYPDLQVFLKEPGELSLAFLSQFDTLVQCGQFWAIELIPIIELLYRKKLRILFCPHGNSDKGHSATHLPAQDILLVYGRQMRDFVEKKRVSYQELITMGNYRLDYYRKHQTFYDAWAAEEIFAPLPPGRETILYAPSWSDGENTTSFFEKAEKIIKELTPHFNLVLKLHPFLEEEHPAETAYLLSQFHHTQGLAVAHNFPPIYPILAKASAYLGDFSSIGYDFLSFNRPLFFIGSNAKSLHLHACGVTVPEDTPLAPFLQKHCSEDQCSTVRQKTYRYAFD